MAPADNDRRALRPAHALGELGTAAPTQARPDQLGRPRLTLVVVCGAKTPPLRAPANQTTEERELQRTDGRLLRHRFVRVPIKIWFREQEIFKERYGGAHGIVVIEGELLKPPTASETVSVFMHPMGIQNMLPMPIAMARAGLHVVTCTSRYPNNDTTLIMEKVPAAPSLAAGGDGGGPG